MPRLKLPPLSPAAEALAAQVRALLKDAKAGEPVTIPADLMRAIDDSVREATAPAILARRRMEWLHSRDAMNVDGYEWGVFRVKWENGRAVEVLQTLADGSDLDAAMQRTAGVTVLDGESKPPSPTDASAQ